MRGEKIGNQTMANQSESRCRVCGLPQEPPAWNALDEPSYLICACCGTEFGVDDVRFTEVLDRRNRWLASGNEWFQPQVKPADWDLMDQLGKLPEEWTLESLGLDPDETAVNIDVQEWTPNYLDYYHFIAQEGLQGRLLTDAQIDRFVEYFVDLCHYRCFYHDELGVEMGTSDGFFPSQQAVFYLNPHAGFSRDSSGAPYKVPTTFKDHADGIWQICTDDYMADFGFLDVKFVQPGAQSTSVELDSVIRSYHQYPAILPKPFPSLGTFTFSNFLYFSPHMLARISECVSAGLHLSDHCDQARYETAIRQLARVRHNKRMPNDKKLKVGMELQEYEKEQLRRMLRNMKEHLAMYATSSHEFYEQNKEQILRRIELEGGSHFVTGIGFLLAYVAAERCEVLPNPEERSYVTRDGKKVAGVVNIPEYEVIVRQENRQRRMRITSVTDRFLLENEFELVRDKKEVQLLLKERYWSYKSEMKLTQVATLPANATPEVIQAAKTRTLQDQRFFTVCEFCWQRKQHMEMHDLECCSACRGPEQDAGEQIVY